MKARRLSLALVSVGAIGITAGILLGLVFMLDRDDRLSPSEKQALRDQRSLTLEGPERIVKGFPIFLRLTAFEPNSPHGLLPLFIVPRGKSYNFPVMKVTFANVETDEQCSVTGHWRTSGMLGLGDLPNLLPGEIRTVVLEVYTVGGRYAARFHDIPPGRYRVQVRAPHLEHDPPRAALVMSNEIEIEIVAQTEREASCYEDLSKNRGWGVRNRAGRNVVLWVPKALDATDLSIEAPDALSSAAQKQLQFVQLAVRAAHYRLLFNRDVSDMDPEATVKLIRETEVPEYLEPERQALLLQWRKLAGEDVAAEIEAFLEKNPGLRWRLEGDQPPPVAGGFGAEW